jgi:MoxR-like ATPase
MTPEGFQGIYRRISQPKRNIDIKESYMNDWYVFTGNKNTPSEDRIKQLPAAPKWRQFRVHLDEADRPEAEEGKKELPWSELRGMKFEASEEAKRMINAALYLRRPLLITGDPGTGKSSLAYAVAHELKLGKVLYWPITTRTTLQEGLYRYDAIGRLQDIQIERLKTPEGKFNPPEIGQYIRLGPLGTAFVPSKRPRVLLLDEIDKSDIDLPNDLLNIFEEGCYEISELSRLPQQQEEVYVYPYDSQEMVLVSRGRVVCHEFPLVILTSNKERQLPAPFLRRCLRLDIKQPEQDELERIVELHFGEEEQKKNKELIEAFLELRRKGSLSTDQLLNAIYLTTKGINLSGDNIDITTLREAIFQYLSKPESL